MLKLGRFSCAQKIRLKQDPPVDGDEGAACSLGTNMGGVRSLSDVV